MKIFQNSLLKTMVAICLSLVLVTTAEASSKSNISNQITDITEQKKNTEANINDAKNKVDNLETQKNKLEIYLDDLNTQLMNLSEQLEDLGNQITTKEEEITTTQQELDDAKAKEEQQYEDMKKRIKFMYENGDTAYLEMFLEAESLSDALNRAEYIVKIYDYDRDMLNEYKETKEEIEVKEELLIQEQEELYVLQADVESKQQQVGEIVASTSTKISSYSNEIAATEKKAKEYEAKLADQNNTLEKLKEAKAAAEKAAKEKAAKEKAAAEAAKSQSAGSGSSQSGSSGGTSGSSGSTSSSAGDLAMLAAIIQCEAGGESAEGKLAVGSVVMNRVNSAGYPNTIVGVIYQSGQFTPVASGRFALVLAQGANSSCVSAAQQVLNGHSSGSWLQFRTVSSGISGTIIGNHVFF
ncbi:cell wall hydrolase [Konateibacter massiliensis]|uniref:cell wall hydrolase n=1 Tax=Konateibacter massiliensis TaxID=2002841 RepID=UPI000C150935|nr:cell wall hydrolase [Konateibacter massiliensis]